MTPEESVPWVGRASMPERPGEQAGGWFGVSELVVPAPRFERWWERLIANMVGQTVRVDGDEYTIKRAGPLDGSPEEGASGVVLQLECVHVWKPAGIDKWRCHCGATRTAIV